MKKGYKHTEEYKVERRRAYKGFRNSGTFKKGNVPWDKGIKRPKFSEEWKGKLSESHKGNKNAANFERTEEYKSKMRLATKGIPKSAEMKLKVSRALKGKEKSREHRKNLSKALTRNPKLSGANNWMWKGGLTTEYKKIRICPEYNNWRKKVYERDGHKCVWCGIVGNGKNLQADHIKPFSLILSQNNIETLGQALRCKELWRIKNGRTLCVDCHRKTDTYFMRGRKQSVEHKRKLALARITK